MHFDEPLISVLLPIKFYDSYVNDSIYSILNQSYSNLEIIIIDDTNSEIFLNFISTIDDKRLIIIKGHNNGISNALNLGIDYSNGLFIARMDSDDIADIDRIKKQFNFLKKNNLDICGSNIKIFGFNNQITNFPENDKDIKYFLLFGCPLAHPTIFGHAFLFKKYKYNNQYNAAEDYELWCRMAIDNVKFGNIKECLLKYRTHNNQATKTNLNNHTNSVKNAIFYAEKYLNTECYKKFIKLNCGFDYTYTNEEIKNLITILYNTLINNNINPIILQNYYLSLFSRIDKITISTFKLFFYSTKKFKLRFHFRFFSYLLIRVIFNYDPREKYLPLIKKLKNYGNFN
jgi:glycosyltransferase involved in cell wall biosynthesis